MNGGGEANPYASPRGEVQMAVAPRPPLEAALAGLLVATVATTATHYLLLPVVAVLEHAAFGYWDFPPAPLELILPLGVAAIFWVFVGAPGVLVLWRLHLLQSRRVLLLGVVLMLLATVGIALATFAVYDWWSTEQGQPIRAYADEIAIVYSSWIAWAVLPLMGGFGGYALWVRRWEYPAPEVTGEAGGETISGGGISSGASGEA